MKKIILRVIAAIIILYIIALIFSRLLAKPNKTKPFIAKLPEFVIIGHQGSPLRHPGNTIESFKETITVNKKAMLEMDVRQTKDGVIIVNHDRDVKTTTNGTGNIDELNYKDIQKLDAGYMITHDNKATYPFRNKGYTMATLEKVLKTFKGVLMSIDIKQHTISCADDILKLIIKYNALENIIIGSFSDDVINHVRKKYPLIATSFSQSEVTKFFFLQKLNLSGFYRAKDDVMMIPEFSDSSRPEYLEPKTKQGFRIISQSFISDAKALNIPILVWTINKKENMNRLYSWKIRGIVTDYPHILNSLHKN
jgi:glycerophosphoryl diester phosphodiesterase